MTTSRANMASRILFLGRMAEIPSNRFDSFESPEAEIENQADDSDDQDGGNDGDAGLGNTYDDRETSDGNRVASKRWRKP